MMGNSDRMNFRRILGATLGVAALVSGCATTQQYADPMLIADPPPTSDGRLPGAGMSDMDRGIAYVTNESYAEAIPHFDLALAAQPSNAAAEYYRALSYDKTGNPAMAEQGYVKALELKPDLMEARIHLGAMYLADPPRPEKAVATLEAAVPASPQAADLRENLAYAYRLLKNYDKSAENYAVVVDVEPSGRLHFAYADMLTEAERHDEAAAQYKLALPHFKDDLDKVVLIADRLARAKRHADCVEAFTLAINLNRTEPQYFLRRGVCKHSLDDEPGARSDYFSALDVDKESQVAWYYIGRSWLSEKNRVKAADALERCWKLGKHTKYGNKAKAVLEEMHKESLR